MSELRVDRIINSTGSGPEISLDSSLNSVKIGTGITFNATTSTITTKDAKFTGIVTASSFAGSFSGNASSASLATTATNLANAANIVTGTINKDRISTTNSLTVLGDLYVSSNISFGGTTTQLNTTELNFLDADIVLGIGTGFIPSDNTANHGGIAVASDEGTPLVNLNIVPGETNPATYKKFMWFKGDSIGAGLTDAWMANYAIGIGSTQVPNGVRLAAGNVKITENDLSEVRNINASGIVTGSSFRPSSGYYQSANGTNALYAYDTSGDVSFQGKVIANNFRSSSNASNTLTLSDLDASFARDLLIAGITTSSGGFVGNLTGTASYATLAGLATESDYAVIAGSATYAETSLSADYATSAGIATYASAAGISSSSDYATSAESATYASTAGVSTYASSAGIATYASTAGVSTYASSAGIATYASAAGISSSSDYATSAGTATTANYSLTSDITNYAMVAGISSSSTIASGLTTTASVNTSGTITAFAFSGDGSGLTGVVTSVVGYATEGYVDAAVIGLATEGYVDAAVIGLATEGYVDAAVVGFATAGDLVGFTTSGDLVGFATSGDLVGFATSGDLVGFTTSGDLVGFATEGYVDAAVVGFTTSGDLVGFATSGDLVGFATAGDLVGLATEGYVDAAVVGFATSGDLVGFATSGDLVGLATEGYVDAAVSGFSGINTSETSTFNNVSASGIVTATNGFTSGIGVTDPVQITVSGNILTFTVVGVGSTSFELV